VEGGRVTNEWHSSLKGRFGKWDKTQPHPRREIKEQRRQIDGGWWVLFFFSVLRRGAKVNKGRKKGLNLVEEEEYRGGERHALGE